MSEMLRGGSINWYGKGRSEESVTLPHELQESLATIEANAGRREASSFTTNPNFLFAGTAKAYNSRKEYGQCLRSGQMRGDYYQEVAAVPQQVESSEGGYNKKSPEELSLTYADSPDFGQIEGRYNSSSSLVGAMRSEVFRSRDGQKNWIFCTDGAGRSYVGGIEANSSVTSTGLRQQWVYGGDLVTPLYEYSKQTGGYGDVEDMRRGYEGMWRYYLSKVPVIREYVGRRLDGGLS